MEITQEEITKAIGIAKNARENAFAIRSLHKVGACVVTSDGSFFGGCNTENDITGFGVCAERSAIDHAVVNGKYEYKAMIVIDDDYCYSCGACLQYMELFSQINDQNITVITAKTTGEYEVNDLYHLLPEGYRTKDKLDLIKSFKNKSTINKVKEIPA